MKSLLLAASVLAFAGSAQALTITSSPLDVAPAAGETVVFDFDGGAPAAGYSYTGGTVFSTSVTNVAAAPSGDTTPFLAIQQGETATFTFATAIKSFSIYIGSVDSFNTLQFTGPGYDSGVFSASVLPGGDNGDQVAGDTNRRFFFTFDGGQSVKTVTLGSGGNSFEIDNIAVANVPEPTTWAMLVGGFGLIGFARRRKSTLKTVAA